MEFQHESILLEVCLEYLNIRPNGVYIDATLGGAGHSLRIAERLTACGRLLCIDRDDEALQNAEIRLTPVRERVTLNKSDFRDLDQVLENNGCAAADGILFDLGVSSPQLDHAERGFSYMQEAPLDMRMDRQQGLTAYDVVNGWSREELRRILFEYGEERYAPLIAAAMERRRQEKPIETTLELVDVIRGAMPSKALREKQHPAKRSFQAIRIAVNDELGAVRTAIEKAIACLAPGGRLAVITFHSLEDRIVKNAFAQAAQGCTCPKDFPVCVCGKKPLVRVVTRKPILPNGAEIEGNPRARSAKLRVCERLPQE
ncbi:MAG: 16S rRNA (cytosine(1402)-N(4))-methyltransferase RsmH [Intestinibacillus sp.]